MQTHTASFKGDANMMAVPIDENTIGSGRYSKIGIKLSQQLSPIITAC